jgi:SAM-dependent methyltransferase
MTPATNYPPRYGRWVDSFLERAIAEVREGIEVLDVGSGPRPSIPPAKRPRKCRYVGLDISVEELGKAPEGCYDDIFVSDVVESVAALTEQFDLVVSWQVLEHVKPLEVALENVRSYLRPGGRFVATLSGRFSAFGVVNQIIPGEWGVKAMHRLLGRRPDTVFPAYYDKCWYSALKTLMAPWRQVEILPFYIGASYFSFSKVLLRAYLRYENWVCNRGYVNLATHYLIDARK